MPLDPLHVTAPAIYVRTAPPDSETAGDTPVTDQISQCLRLAAGRGWSVPAERIYSDDGYSGTATDRPALGRLRAAVAAGRVDCVLTARLDRLSCGLPETVDLVGREWAEILVWSVGEGFHTAAPPGPLIIAMLAAYAAHASEALRRRTENGRQRSFAEGQRPVGDPPFGYARGQATGSMVINPAQAAVIRQIFARYLEGYGFAKIAGLLNAQGCRTGNGNRWTDKTVRDVAMNAVYAGKVKYRGQYGPGRHEPIIDEATFAAVQAVRGARERLGGRSAGSPFLLAGLVRCKGCGQLFHTQPANESKRYRKDGQFYLTQNPAYYQCGGRLKQGAGFCRCGQIRQAVLEAHVVERLRARFGPQLAAEGAEAGGVSVDLDQWETLPLTVRKQLVRCLIDRILVWQPSRGQGRFKEQPELEVDIVWNRSERTLPPGDLPWPRG